jgi:phosphate transport system substrate-binding protein
VTSIPIIRRSVWAVGAAVLAVVLGACGSNDPANDSAGGTTEELSGTVVIDGSSTVAPLSTVAAELFMEKNPGVNVTVGTSGTGGGFEKFCAGETDISDASRAIEDDEKAACESNQITYDEFAIANDALTVVVNKGNDWATDLTVDQLKAIWAPGSTVNNWNQVDPSFPNEPLQLFGPGTDSGTFDYFTAEINGEEGASRTDYQASEDDNVIVQGVEGAKSAMGYFGFTYFEENAEKLNAVSIGGVKPSAETVQDGTYTPLGRQLFIYPSKTALDEKPEVKAFVDFYVKNVDQIVEEGGFIGLNEQQKDELTRAYENLVS